MYCITTKTNKSPSSSFKCIHVFMVARVCYTKKRNQEFAHRKSYIHKWKCCLFISFCSFALCFLIIIISSNVLFGPIFFLSFSVFSSSSFCSPRMFVCLCIKASLFDNIVKKILSAFVCIYFTNHDLLQKAMISPQEDFKIKL